MRLEGIGATVDELLDDLEEAADPAIALASGVRTAYPAEAAKTTEIARCLANIRTGSSTRSLGMDWRAVPDLPF